MATSLYKGQIHFRAKGQSTCSRHRGGQLYLYCKKCEELACIKCLSTSHNSHPLCSLSEVTSEQKRDIQTFVDKTERVDLVQVDKYITSTDEQLKDNSRNFEKLSHNLKTQTNKLKHDLDLLTTQTLSLYQQMEEENTKLLQTYKQNLEMYSAQLKQQVQDCKIALQRGSDILIYDTGHAIQSPVTLPVKPTLGIASFTPNENSLVHLEQALGEVNTSGQIQGQPFQGHDRSVWSSAGQTQSRTRLRKDTEGRTPSTQQISTGRKTQFGQPLQGYERPVWSSAGQRKSATRQRSETEGRTPSTQQRSTERKPLTSPVQSSTVQYSPVQSNTVQYSTEQYRTVQYSPVQSNTVQYSTEQYSPHSPVQYSPYSPVQYSPYSPYSPVQSSTLLSQTKLLGEWRAPSDISAVCPTTDGQVWTSDDNSDTLTLLDRKGKVIQEVKHNTEIRDISQSPTTNTLWICDEENNIKELVSGQLVHRFSTREIPQCICITATKNVIVGMVTNISKYTTKGKLVLTTSAMRTWKPLVCSPERITECPVTHNVAVADFDSSNFGGEDKPRVVVVDTDFKELFVYGGEVPHIYQPTSQSGDEPFNPSGVVYDSVGNLVIGDHDNGHILLLSGRGEFLRVIHTDDFCIWTLGIDREGILWAVFEDGIFKLLQYSSV